MCNELPSIVLNCDYPQITFIDPLTLQSTYYKNYIKFVRRIAWIFDYVGLCTLKEEKKH